MLRVNLLRELPPSPSTPSSSGPARQGTPPATPGLGHEGAGTLRPVLLTLLGLLVLGVVALYFAKPPWLNLEGLSGFSFGSAQRDAARADSLRRVEDLRADASRLVVQRQSLAIEWLDQIEAALPVGAGTPAMIVSSYTSSGAFVLHGSVATAEDISAIQEALVLIPGMDLRESRADELEAPETGFDFNFSGIVTLPVDTAPPLRDLVTPAGELERHLNALREAALLEGIEFAAPQAGAAVASGALRLQPYRLSGLLNAPDSAAFSALRNILAGERHRGSPFSVQRVTMKNRNGKTSVFLDIMAYTP